MPSITLTPPEYDALLALAFRADPREGHALRARIDKANGVRRYTLFVRWQDLGVQPPRTIELGKGWPPEQSFLIELTRPITPEDVEGVLTAQAVDPVGVQVTPDRHGVVGWTQLEAYDWNIAT
jgi:hypothetical protein